MFIKGNRRKGLLSLLSLLLVIGCSKENKPVTEEGALSEEGNVSVACRRPFIVRDLSRQFMLEGPSHFPGVRMKARVEIERIIGGACDVDSKGFKVNAAVRISATKGPAYHDEPVKTQYFMALANSQGKILAMVEKDVTFTFAENEKYAGITSIVESPTIMVSSAAEAADLSVMIGLLLSEDELMYNQKIFPTAGGLGGGLKP